MNTLCKYSHTRAHILSAHNTHKHAHVNGHESCILQPVFKALGTVHSNTTVNTSPHLHETQRMKNIKGCNQESEKVGGEVNSIREDCSVFIDVTNFIIA